MMKMRILLPGYPIKGSRGYLGWSNVILLEDEGKRILFDTGSYGDRHLLLEKLEEASLSVDEIDYVVLSHLHFDHASNVVLFPEARIVISEREWEYATTLEYEQKKDTFIPLPLIQWLQREKARITLTSEGDNLTENLSIMLLPGHTPGSLGLLIPGEETMLLGDAVKSGFEFQSATPSYHFDTSQEWLKSFQRIKEALKIIPGHDVPLILEEGVISHWEETPLVTLEYTPFHRDLNRIILEDRHRL